jgi:pyruvyltransferase
MNNANPLKLHWSSSLKHGKKNFGDWLSPELCQLLSGRSVVHAAPNQADLVAIGSILQRVKHRFWNRKTHIWGSGFIEHQNPVHARHFYHAVRGKKTASLIKGAKIAALGDPGLLVDRLLPDYRKIAKDCRIGLIPHYKDQSNPYVKAIAERFTDIKIVDIYSETQEFLHQSAACEVILSSSLHGLIVADAFGIPNAWIKLSNAVRGDDFKFQDYYSVFDIAPTALLPDETDSEALKKIEHEYHRPHLESIKGALLAAFPYR